MTDWNLIEEQFIRDGAGLRELAQRHGVSYSTLAARARKGKWRQRRRQEPGPMAYLSRSTDKLAEILDRASAPEHFFDGESGQFDAKAFRAAISSLKDLTDTARRLGGEADAGETLTVELGEAEDYAG